MDTKSIQIKPSAMKDVRDVKMKDESAAVSVRGERWRRYERSRPAEVEFTSLELWLGIRASSVPYSCFFSLFIAAPFLNDGERNEKKCKHPVFSLFHECFIEG